MNRRTFTTLLALTLAVASCSWTEQRLDGARQVGSRATASLSTPTGISGAVASAETNATLVAMQVLEEGGNAVDAAVALSFALAVTYPGAGNIGGGGFFLYRDPSGEAWYLDFREVAPALATADMYLDADGNPDRAASTLGWKAAGVPGSVFGMWEAHQRWGSLPWERLLAPAARLADQGFALSAFEARDLNRNRTAMEQDLRARAVFVREDGLMWEEGDVLRQPTLASTLHALAAQGEAAFRSGPIVNATVAASREGGGILSAEDFADYEPTLRAVHRIGWQGMELLTATPPSSGGVFLHQVLELLDGAPLAEWGYRDPRTVQLIGEAEAAAFRDRNRWLGDPASMDFPYYQLLDPGYLAERRAALSPDRFTAPDDSLPEPPVESSETTHYSVLDANGGAVAVTTTLNGWYGAKVLAPGGFFMNNEMDDFAAKPGHANQFGLVQSKTNAVHAGRRPLSSMSPVIVVRDGEVDAILGSPGGPTILTTVLQVLLHRYVFDMAPEDAVEAPRFHRQDRPPTLRYESGRLGRPTMLALRELGQPLEAVSRLGHVCGIFRDGKDWAAIADARRGGLGQVLLGSD